MNIVDKQLHICTTVDVSTNIGHRQIHIVILNERIYFHSNNMQTELSVFEAKMKPLRIANCVFALVPEVYAYETENVVKYLSGLI